MITEDTAILLLAAGRSFRMGEPKQLLEYQGEKLINRMIRIGKKADCGMVAVVLGAYAQQIREVLDDKKVLVVQNREWQEGMSSSLRVGIEAIEAASNSIQQILVILVDQPFINTKHLNQMLSLANQSEKNAVATAYEGIPGVPALFKKCYWPALKSQSGDKGARKLLMTERAHILEIDFPLGKIDLDTPEDWEQFTGQNGY